MIWLPEEIVFPPYEIANEDGVLAFGGDLSAERLVYAYKNGIFPWYSEGQPILWWSPDPRMVLFPKNLKVSKSFRKTINSEKFTNADMIFGPMVAKNISLVSNAIKNNNQARLILPFTPNTKYIQGRFLKSCRLHNI